MFVTQKPFLTSAALQLSMFFFFRVKISNVTLNYTYMHHIYILGNFHCFIILTSPQQKTCEVCLYSLCWSLQKRLDHLYESARPALRIQRMCTYTLYIRLSYTINLLYTYINQSSLPDLSKCHTLLGASCSNWNKR